MVNLTAHEPQSPLPCLCKQCLVKAPQQASAGGLEFKRLEVTHGNRTLHAWYPEELSDELDELKLGIARRLANRDWRGHGPKPELLRVPERPKSRPAAGTSQAPKSLWQRLVGWLR